jgi:hypothetical protein
MARTKQKPNQHKSPHLKVLTSKRSQSSQESSDSQKLVSILILIFIKLKVFFGINFSFNQISDKSKVN